MDRDATPLSEEPFHRDSRAQAAFFRKCVAFAGLLGSCSACSILSWRRFGTGFVPRSARTNDDDNNDGMSFLQRYLITPLLLPAALGVTFVVVRGTVFEREFRHRERAREEWELQNYRKGELDEMVRIYVARGLRESQAQQLVDVVSSNDHFFVDTMMTDELGFSPVEPPTIREGLSAGLAGACSFLAAAILPLLAADRFDYSNDGNNFKNKNNKNNNNNQNLSYVPEGVLAVTSLVYSLLQARMLLRSYTVRSDVVQSVVCNCGWVLATYALTTWSCKMTFFPVVSTVK